MPIYLEVYFWLIAVSLFFFAWERFRPWRPKQEVLRKGFVQDVFWLVFNTQYMGWMLAVLTVELIALCDQALASIGVPTTEQAAVLAVWPLWAQFIFAFALKDFMEWNVHRLLHKVPWLWEFHKLHHSIEELDWLGAFRTHWGEIIIYRLVTFLPLVLLGVAPSVILVITVSMIAVQELIHANIRLELGPLKYVLNSPKFHAWHHDLKLHGRYGQNFAVCLSCWDFLFGTAYQSGNEEQPKRLGFHGMKSFPRAIWGRFVYPFYRRRKTDGRNREIR